jgi:charged multivesicular body protein 3
VFDFSPQLDTATSKVRQTIKQLAVKGDVKSARILAREVVRSDKQKDRLSVSKARLGSIGSQLSQQLGLCCCSMWVVILTLIFE